MTHREWKKARYQLTLRLRGLLSISQTPERVLEIDKIKSDIAACDEQRKKSAANGDRIRGIIAARRGVHPEIVEIMRQAEKVSEEIAENERQAERRARFRADRAAAILRDEQGKLNYLLARKAALTPPLPPSPAPEEIERAREEGLLKETASSWEDLVGGVTPLAREDA